MDTPEHQDESQQFKIKQQNTEIRTCVESVTDYDFKDDEIMWPVLSNSQHSMPTKGGSLSTQEALNPTPRS